MKTVAVLVLAAVPIWALACAPYHTAPTPSAAQSARLPDERASATSEPTEQAHARPNKTPHCEALTGWRYEKISLPPQFAPQMPSGTEVLWFSPGMFNRESPDYFTYAFSLDFVEGRPAPDRWATLLTQYYRGLMTAVAGDERSPAKDAVVTISEAGDQATIELSDEFNDGAIVTLSLRISSVGQCLRVLATARPSDAQWTTLERSFDCLCTNVP